MKKYAVIVAAGSGTRMGSTVPKQFLPVNGKPMLYYSMDAFRKAFADIDIIVVLPKEYFSKGREVAGNYFPEANIQFVVGGRTRFHSVKNGLQLAAGESIIFVHDAARCLVSPALIGRCYVQAAATGSAVPAVPCKDSVRMLTGNGSEALDRSKVVLIQTPQTFSSSILLPAFATDYKEKFTDEATVVEDHGISVSLVEGDDNNIKVTGPLDLMVAEKLLTL